MRYEFKLPDLAEGMIEGEVVDWLVSPNDVVAEEQPIVEMMTDKATVTISSPRAGKVVELSFASGDIAPVGHTLFVLEVEGTASEPVESADKPPEPAPDEPRAQAFSDIEPSAAGPEPPPITAPSVPVPRATPRGAGRALATPATRRKAREMGVDIQMVTGTGPGGRVVPEDLVAFKSGPVSFASAPAAPVSTAPLGAATVTQQPVALPPSADAAIPLPTRPGHSAAEESETREKVRGLRRAIHDAMHRSLSTAAHFTYVDDVDCTNLIEARRRLKPAAERYGLRLNYLPFIAKASLLALNAFPKMNGSMDDSAGEMVIKHHRHLGIAAATDAGLTVPTIRHADRLTLLELAAAIAALGDKARRNALTPKEVGGSTFTISSLGKLGGILATPIINHPEVAILGIHRMEERAVVRGGEIVVRSMMNISLSFDHRVIDGHEGAAFAERIKHYLEDPELMMLEMV